MFHIKSFTSPAKVLSVALALANINPTPANAEDSFILAHGFGTDHFVHPVGEQFAELIAEASGGAFVVDYHPGGDLGDYIQQFEQTMRQLFEGCHELITAVRRGLLEQAINEFLELNRIEIIAATGNAPSQRVAVKAGAVREGVLRHRIVCREHVYDAVSFSLVPADVLTGEAR